MKPFISLFLWALSPSCGTKGGQYPATTIYGLCEIKGGACVLTRQLSGKVEWDSYQAGYISKVAVRYQLPSYPVEQNPFGAMRHASFQKDPGPKSFLIDHAQTDPVFWKLELQGKAKHCGQYVSGKNVFNICVKAI